MHSVVREGAVKVALAFSGGLDTSFCVPWLRERKGADVVTVTVNTGGATRHELDAVAERSRSLGASDHVEVDARRAVWDRWIATLVRGNVLRGEVYPLCVAAERTQQAIEVARVARETEADAVAHGSTGAGNDQVRFDVAFRVLLPGVEILTPIRDLEWDRGKTATFLAERGLEVPRGSGRYSINRGLWGTTFGGDWTHDPWTPPPEDAFPEPAGSGPDPRGEEVVIGWDRGLPVSIDGVAMEGPALVEALGSRTERYAVGRGIHIGETVLGIKGRIGFEAGAALVLIHAHREIEKLVLSRAQAFWKDHLARFWGERLHEGDAFDPVLGDIRALVESSQARVRGETRVRLQPGRFLVTGVRSPESLVDASVARYGETHALWSGSEARAFAKLRSIPGRLAYRRVDGEAS